MTGKHELSETWIKASIAGTLWAASEIVLGSFLHNLRVPFSGNILTAIGLIILISISYIWKDRGLFWRAGLICAVMKTMSPSAVIFGPMIAIISESLLLEISTMALGRNAAGYLAGASLAMSWNLFQRIINFIIFYGFNIVDLYTNIMDFAGRQLHLHFNAIWGPIILLMVLYVLFGLFAAMIGIRIGRLMVRQPAAVRFNRNRDQTSQKETKSGQAFRYSIAWLLADIIVISGLLAMLNYVSWYLCIPIVAFVVVVWSFRYNRALRQLKKPGFWISFVLITMVTAFVFSRLQSDPRPWWEGMIIGIQMNLRATIIIVGFSVLGTELYNPRIKDFFSRTYFRQLPLALELSFESLPAMISSIPEFRSVIRNPVPLLYQVIAQAEQRFAEIKSWADSSRHVFIISGGKGTGKTHFLMKVTEVLRAANIRTGGFFSRKVTEDGVTAGYNLVDIRSNEEIGFLRLHSRDDDPAIGRFSMIDEGYRKGLDILKPENNGEHDVVVLDEVGRLELSGKGWAQSLHDLIRQSRNHLILVVRESFINEVILNWEIRNYTLFPISGTNPQAVAERIIEIIRS